MFSRGHKVYQIHQFQSSILGYITKTTLHAKTFWIPEPLVQQEKNLFPICDSEPLFVLVHKTKLNHDPGSRTVGLSPNNSSIVNFFLKLLFHLSPHKERFSSHRIAQGGGGGCNMPLWHLPGSRFRTPLPSHFHFSLMSLPFSGVYPYWQLL